MPSADLADGTRIHYLESGAGEQPVVLVHGFGGDSRSMGPLFAHYSSITRTISIDLRAHGRSGHSGSPCTYSRLAQDINEVLQILDITEAVMIGHSMGAGVVLEAATMVSEQASAVISIDGILSQQEPSAGSSLAPMLQHAADYRAVLREFMENVVVNRSPDVLSIIRETEPPPLAFLLELLADIPNRRLDDSLSQYSKPLLQIMASRPPMNSLQALAPQIVQGLTVGAGHYCQLEVPSQVNSMIDRFLQINDPQRWLGGRF